MEILKAAPVMEHTWYFEILIAWIVCGTCAACILIGAKQKALTASICIFVVVAVILLFTVPIFHETGKMQYIIRYISIRWMTSFIIGYMKIIIYSLKDIV